MSYGVVKNVPPKHRCELPPRGSFGYGAIIHCHECAKYMKYLGSGDWKYMSKRAVRKMKERSRRERGIV